MKHGVIKGIAALVMGWTRGRLRLFLTYKSLSLITRQAETLLRFLFLTHLGIINDQAHLSVLWKSIWPLCWLTRNQRESLSQTDLSYLLSCGSPPPTVVFSKEGRKTAPSLANSRRKPMEWVECSPGTHLPAAGSCSPWAFTASLTLPREKILSVTYMY